MPVQFILGRAGSGKTQHLLDQILQRVTADPLGPPIYWLLPKQATFQIERLLTATLNSFSRVRVVSIDQLGKEILIHCGDVGNPPGHRHRPADDHRSLIATPSKATEILHRQRPPPRACR